MNLTILTLFHEFPLTFIIRVVLTLVAFAAGAVFAVRLYKKDRITRSKMVLSIILWLYVLVVLYFTVIGRYSHEEYTVRLQVLNSYRNYILTGDKSELHGIIVNIIMFIPFAFLSAALFKDKKPVIITLALGLVLTLLIEFLQLITHTGTFEIDDILNNLLGTIFGIILWNICDELVINQSSKNRRNEDNEET